MYTQVKNLQWANAEHTLLNCEVNFNHLNEEFVNFTASATDTESYTRDIFTKAIAGNFGPIKEYIKYIPSLEQIKEEKKQEINIQAGNARSKYITVIPGQESTYQFKLQEAQEYVNATTPNVDDFPFLFAEAQSIGIPIIDLANTILQTWATWKPIAAKIEATRRKLLVEVNSATTVDDVMNIVIEFI